MTKPDMQTRFLGLLAVVGAIGAAALVADQPAAAVLLLGLCLGAASIDLALATRVVRR